jgi:hypothetical protein
MFHTLHPVGKTYWSERKGAENRDLRMHALEQAAAVSHVETANEARRRRTIWTEQRQRVNAMVNKTRVFSEIAGLALALETHHLVVTASQLGVRWTFRQAVTLAGESHCSRHSHLSLCTCARV